MHKNKRALALWLGLFFYLNLSLTAEPTAQLTTQEFFFKTGTLFVNDDGASYYRQTGLSLNQNNIFSLGLKIGEITSTLPLLDTSVSVLSGHYIIDTPEIGFNLTAGYFNHKDLNITIGNNHLFNEDGRGHLVSLKMPYNIGFFGITPFVFFCNASWKDGHFYWFFGKPKLSLLQVYGLNTSLELFNYKHNIGFYTLDANVDIVSNDYKHLFSSSLDAGLLSYKIEYNYSDIDFSGTIGWIYTKALLEGSLNTSNQLFPLFPYLFYNVNAFYNANAGFALFQLKHSVSILQFKYDLGIFHIFNNEGKLDINYRRKTLFGGGTFHEESIPDLKDLGFMLLVLDVSIPSMPIRESAFSMGIQKAFIVPWGYKDIFTIETDTLSLIKTVLKSGFSLRLSINL